MPNKNKIYFLALRRCDVMYTLMALFACRDSEGVFKRVHSEVLRQFNAQEEFEKC